MDVVMPAWDARFFSAFGPMRCGRRRCNGSYCDANWCPGASYVTAWSPIPGRSRTERQRRSVLLIALYRKRATRRRCVPVTGRRINDCTRFAWAPAPLFLRSYAATASEYEFGVAFPMEALKALHALETGVMRLAAHTPSAISPSAAKGRNTRPRRLRPLRPVWRVMMPATCGVGSPVPVPVQDAVGVGAPKGTVLLTPSSSRMSTLLTV